MIERVDQSAVLNDVALACSEDVFRTCCYNTDSPEAAWDAFQDTFLALARRYTELDHSSDLRPWLRETARRCSLAVVGKDRRRNARVSLTPELDGVPQIARQNDELEYRELTQMVTEELAKLPAADQELLRLIHAEGQSHRDVAPQMHCPTGSVHARVTRAHNRLRQRMKRRGAEIGLLLLVFLFNDRTVFAGSSVPPTQPHVPKTRTTTFLRRILTGLVVVLLGLIGYHNTGTIAHADGDGIQPARVAPAHADEDKATICSTCTTLTSCESCTD
jgi:RNA polymerase sigma factor (sigma-70 family)